IRGSETVRFWMSVAAVDRHLRTFVIGSIKLGTPFLRPIAAQKRRNRGGSFGGALCCLPRAPQPRESGRADVRWDVSSNRNRNANYVANIERPELAVMSSPVAESSLRSGHDALLEKGWNPITRDAPDRRLLVAILLAIALVALPAPPARSPPSPPPPASGDRIADLKGKIETRELDNRTMTKARVYADVNVLRPKDYWDYESLTVQWGYARY
ncbi:hypothetical protein GW17_00056175, partial [Ensete ventricosum]